MKLSTLYKHFFASERSGGIVLIVVTIISILLTNSPLGISYAAFWSGEIGSHSLTHWINDGLMAIFFLLIGLELKREIRSGELSTLKKAILPVFAAIGGMIIPAAIYFATNYHSPTQAGIGIPMATDIAFALGILSLLGNKVPPALKIFLTAVAVIDDLGAIIIIAIFYTKQLSWLDLSIALSIFGLLLVLNKTGVKNLLIYLTGGICMWYFMLHSGVHATITGVLIAFAIPFNNGEKNSPCYKLQQLLHNPVAFIILPLFAAANTCILIEPGFQKAISENETIGILLGLIIGKPAGIFLFSFLAVTLRYAVLPSKVNWKLILAIGFLGGIGFTMSIFITLLAFDEPLLINHSKISVLAGSFISGLIGYLYLKNVLRRKTHTE
jgi:NhaA family Na+:H+ antiporter